jgi:hypothetical protein
MPWPRRGVVLQHRSGIRRGRAFRGFAAYGLRERHVIPGSSGDLCVRETCTYKYSTLRTPVKSGATLPGRATSTRTVAVPDLVDPTCPTDTNRSPSIKVSEQVMSGDRRVLRMSRPLADRPCLAATVGSASCPFHTSGAAASASSKWRATSSRRASQGWSCSPMTPARLTGNSGWCRLHKHRPEASQLGIPRFPSTALGRIWTYPSDPGIRRRRRCSCLRPSTRVSRSSSLRRTAERRRRSASGSVRDGSFVVAPLVFLQRRTAFPSA